MYVNKVLYGEEVLFDLTGDTVTADTLAEGVTAHNASGEMIVGTMRDGSEITEMFVPKVSENGELVWTFPTFEIDNELYLCVTYDEPYSEEMFVINDDGYLEVIIYE